MTFQLRSLVLYNTDGRSRRVDFNLGRLNIITGASKTGKSSILDIVDYCLGSDGFGVSSGVVRDSVATYALILSLDGGQQLLLARPRPRGRNKSTSAMHVRMGSFDGSEPPLDSLQPTTEIEAVRAYLSSLIGIEDATFELASGRRSAPVNIRHSLFFLFQEQGEVANPDLLFHAQGQEFRPQAIRDTLPYFLGVVDPDLVSKRIQLRELTRQFKALVRDQEDTSAISSNSAIVESLLAEARDVGLLNGSSLSDSRAGVLAALSSAMAPRDDQPDLQDESTYLDLLDDRDQLRRSLADAQAELRILDHVAAERSEFEEQAGEQSARLASLGLLPEQADSEGTCPLCTSVLPNPVPTVQVLRGALAAMSNEIRLVRVAEPRLRDSRASIEARIAELRRASQRNAGAIRELESSRQELAPRRYEVVRRATVQGRIALYLDAVGQEELPVGDAARVEELQEKITAIEAELDESHYEEKLADTLSQVGLGISEIARQLSLEHSEWPVRLDHRRLTVVADTADGPVPLGQMGSGENWLGYHLSVLLALQEWFIGKTRPIPRFLILDQPSQVYFPADQTGDASEPATDHDRLALTRALSEIARVVAELAPNLQVLILDHADLDEPWFQAAVIERWRGEALIPNDWLYT